MPVISVSSVSRQKMSVIEYVEPTIGMVLDTVSDTEGCTFIRDLTDYYAKISEHDQRIINLINAGYSLKALTTKVAPAIKRNIRLFSNDYCYPTDLSVTGEEILTGDQIKFTQMSMSNTYSFEFTLPEDIVINEFQEVTYSSGILHNPKKEGWFELVDGKYVKTEDSTVEEGKTYYEAVVYTEMNGRFLSIFQGNITGTIIWYTDDEEIRSDTPIGKLIGSSDTYIVIHDLHDFSKGYDAAGHELEFGLVTWLEHVMGLNVKIIDTTYICSRADYVSVSYYTNLPDTVVEPSKLGNSDFYNLNRSPVLDIETKYSYYSDNMKVEIKNVAGIKYTLKFLVDDKVVEVFDYLGTSASANDITNNSELVNLTWHASGSLPTGIYALSTSEIYLTSSNQLQLSKYEGFPHPFLVLGDGVIKDTNRLDCFDSEGTWTNSLIRVSGELLMEDDLWYPAGYLYLLRIRDSDLLGTVHSAKQLRGAVPDSNVPTNNVYTLDLLTLIYYYNGEKTSYINKLTQNMIYTYILNNLTHKTSITYIQFTDLVDSIRNWLQSFNSYQVTRFEQSGTNLYIDLEIAIDGYKGIVDYINLSFIIKDKGDK